MKSKKAIFSLDALLVFLLFFFNNETLSNNLCTFVDQPVRLVTVFIALVFLYRVLLKNNKINVSVLLLTLLLSAFIFFAFLFDTEFTGGYVLLFMGVLNGMFIASLIPFERFCDLYVRISSFFALMSLLLTYILKPVISAIPSIFKVVTNSADVSFYNAFICYIRTGEDGARNWGIFREPGVYAIFLCISILFLCFVVRGLYSKRRFIYYLVLLLITLFSTLSTTGFIAIILIFMALFLSQSINRRDKRFYLLLVIFMLVMMLMFFAVGNVDSPFEKLNSESSGYSSFEYRLETIVAGIKVTLRQPLGYGLQNGIEVLKSEYTMNNYHNTSTWVSMSVYLGIPYLIVCLIFFFRFFKTRIKSWLVFIPFFLLLSAEALVYNPFIYILLMYSAKIGFIERRDEFFKRN